MFFYLCKVLFSGFLEFRGNFVDGRNNSKYRDVAPLAVFSNSTDYFLLQENEGTPFINKVNCYFHSFFQSEALVEQVL